MFHKEAQVFISRISVKYFECTSLTQGIYYFRLTLQAEWYSLFWVNRLIGVKYSELYVMEFRLHLMKHISVFGFLFLNKYFFYICPFPSPPGALHSLPCARWWAPLSSISSTQSTLSLIGVFTRCWSIQKSKSTWVSRIDTLKMCHFWITWLSLW